MARGAIKHNKRTLLTNAAWNWLGFATAVVVTFVVCPIYVRSLGETRYGIWSLVESVVAYFALLDLGIGASVVRYVSRFEAIEDRDQLNRVFSTTLAIFVAAACFTLAVSGGMATVWTRPLGVPSELSADARWLLFLLGCNVSAELIAGVFGAVLLGLGRYPARVVLDLVLRIGGAMVAVGVLSLGYGLVGIGVVCVAFTLAKGFLLASLVWHYLPDLQFSPALISIATFRVIRGYSFLAFAAMIAGRVSFSTDALVIGALLSPEHITYFVVAARLIEYAKSGFRSITSVLTPAFSSMEACGDYQTIRQVFVDGARCAVWIAVVIELGIIVFGKEFLCLWLGEQLAVLSYPTLVILVGPLVFCILQFFSARVLYGTGRLKLFTSVVATEAVANLLLSILLARFCGIEGVAIGTAVPNVVSNFVVIWYVCRLLGLPVVTHLRSVMCAPAIAAVLPLAVWYVVGKIVPITGWGTLIFVGSTGTLAYGGVAWLIEWWIRRPEGIGMGSHRKRGAGAGVGTLSMPSLHTELEERSVP